MEQALIEEYRDALPAFIQSFRETSRAIIEEDRSKQEEVGFELELLTEQVDLLEKQELVRRQRGMLKSALLSEQCIAAAETASKRLLQEMDSSTYQKQTKLRRLHASCKRKISDFKSAPVIKEVKPRESFEKSVEHKAPIPDRLDAKTDDEKQKAFSFEEMLKARGKYSFSNQQRAAETFGNPKTKERMDRSKQTERSAKHSMSLRKRTTFERGSSKDIAHSALEQSILGGCGQTVQARR